MRALLILVAGTGDADPRTDAQAEAVGAALAHAGATVLCGGRGGVMAAACRGAKRAGGRTLAILPGVDVAEANEWVDVALPSGMGEARNVLLVRAAAAVIAIGGGYGTLSEIAFALKVGTPVVGLGSWAITGVTNVEDPGAAVATALRSAADRSSRGETSS